MFGCAGGASFYSERARAERGQESEEIKTARAWPRVAQHHMIVKNNKKNDNNFSFVIIIISASIMYE